MASFLRNDACPEICVKTLLAGQTYLGNSLWDIGCFEYIACRAFDALVAMMAVAAELGREISYDGGRAPARLEADRVLAA